MASALFNRGAQTLVVGALYSGSNVLGPDVDEFGPQSLRVDHV